MGAVRFGGERFKTAVFPGKDVVECSFGGEFVGCCINYIVVLDLDAVGERVVVDFEHSGIL